MADKKCGVNTKCYIDSSGIDSESKTVEVILSDETPVSWYHPEVGKCTLVMSHAEDAIDLSRKDVMSVFWAHNDYALPIGIYENVRVEGLKLKATANFDKDDNFAMQIFGKIEKGIIRSLSIGADILEKTITKDENNKITVTATRWQPYEGSFTGNPANENARVGLRNQNKEIKMEKPTFNDAKIFIATASEDEKVTLMRAMGGISVDALKQKADEVVTLMASHTETLNAKQDEMSAILENAKASMSVALTMVNAEQFSYISHEDKKLILDEVNLSADGKIDVDKLELSLFKKMNTLKAPLSGQGSPDTEVSEEVANMGGKF